MKIITTVAKMQEQAMIWRQEGQVVGFVPTMGYLHDGHISLLDAARAECDKVILSIFVNPTQFGPKEDLSVYPRNACRDIRIAKTAGVDAVFFPTEQVIYPEGYATYVYVENLEKKLCGQTRPIHFKGVTTIVTKLFHITQPHYAYFGQKDAQQAIILRRMVEDLNMPIIMRIMPIIRETDGLAMSSRNAYLSDDERQQALVLSTALKVAQERFKQGDTAVGPIRKQMEKIIATAPSARIDYIAFVDTKTLEPMEALKEGTLVALAVYIGKTRLIDNWMI